MTNEKYFSKQQEFDQVLLTNLPRIIVACNEFIQTQNRYPTSLDKIGILTYFVRFCFIDGREQRSNFKVHIPLGVPAASKQSPTLMCMEYPVLLPDHTFVVASKYKLISSIIYASREIKLSRVTYSDPTYAAIRLLKGDNADAFVGFVDLKDLLENDNSKPFLKQEDECIKPIWIFTRDGHDGLSFPTTRRALIKFFNENDIDFIVAAGNASGLSAYHFIERRMVPQSKELAGLILPHKYFGTPQIPRNSKISEKLETYCQIYGQMQ